MPYLPFTSSFSSYIFRNNKVQIIIIIYSWLALIFSNVSCVISFLVFSEVDAYMTVSFSFHFNSSRILKVASNPKNNSFCIYLVIVRLLFHLFLSCLWIQKRALTWSLIKIHVFTHSLNVNIQLFYLLFYIFHLSTLIRVSVLWLDFMARFNNWIDAWIQPVWR